MGLNLVALSRQVREMTSALAASASNHSRRCHEARHRYLTEAGGYNTWAKLAWASRATTPFPLAQPLEAHDTAHDLPPCPDAYELVATDGSHLDVDRHGVSFFGLINTGKVFLRYGAAPVARLSSVPSLYYNDENAASENAQHQRDLEAAYLSAQRDVAEIEALVVLAEECLSGILPAIALLDGTLIRRSIPGADATEQQRFLQPYLQALSTLRRHDILVAAYISRPRSPEVVGTIRLMHCPDARADVLRPAVCKSCSDIAAGRTPSCGTLRGLTDVKVLGDTLRQGQRGPLFRSLSRINIAHYGEHCVHFFYLHAGREIARVEIPQWVAEDRTALTLAHTLIYDQIVRGQGYPVGLARAHEQAVIRGTDRRALLQLVEQSLVRSELPARLSGKARSKSRQAL